MKMKLVVPLFLLALSGGVLAQQKPAPKSPAGTKKTESKSTSGWTLIGERGEMKWVQGPKVWPEVIVLKLTHSQYGRFAGNPTDFLNNPKPVFSKAVNPMSTDCQKRAKDTGSSGADSFYVVVYHDPGSTSCPSVLPHFGGK